MDAGGENARVLTSNTIEEHDLEISPDNSQVLFLADTNERFEPYYPTTLFVVPAAGGVGKYAYGSRMKRELLRREGVDVDALDALAKENVRFIGSRTTKIFCFRRTFENHGFAGGARTPTGAAEGVPRVASSSAPRSGKAAANQPRSAER